MKNKSNLIIVILIITLSLGITVFAAYAHGPGRGYSEGNGMDGNIYGMMGGHGMMGGDRSGNDMMGGYGHTENGYSRDMWNQNRRNSKNYRQNSPNFKTETESLRNQIQKKRQELSSLYRSGNADKALMDRKIDELNNLEKYLDEKISSGDPYQ